MAHTFLKAYQVTHGTLGGEVATDDDESLYVTVGELENLYGVCATEADIRAAMALIAAECNRPTLWPCLYDSGILEVPPDRFETRLPITPVIQITDIAGKFGLGRRDRQGWSQTYGLAASYFVMVGNTPQWVPMDPAKVELQPETGVIWLTPSLYFFPWNFVKCQFVAGLLTIPDRVKLAVCEIINTIKSRQVSSRMRYSMGRFSQAFSGEGFVSAQAKQLLSPYTVASYY